MATTELTLENPIIEPKEAELPLSPTVPAATLLPANVLNDTPTDADDDCVICYQTLYRPAKTSCNHSACESCMLHWALTAMDVKPEDQILSMNLSVEGLKFKCPTCRTYTSATFDVKRNETLQARYSTEYASRAAELTSEDTASDGDETAQTMILMLGNSHRTVPPSISPYTGKIRTHEWTFFVQSSRQDIIEQVDVILHPTFRQDRLVTLRTPPFATTHLGWGYFRIYAGITLREGWEWVGEERVVDSDAQKGRCRDRLPVEWVLDFGAGGSWRSRGVKVRRVREEVGIEEGKAEEKREDGEDEDDLDGLAELMSASEIAQLREVRRLRRVREQSD
ncbi:hypothetical protein PMZ80_008885 [Knufia obscura]|uniref:RING-type domain-containing protein n=1 Tax=Knufia obscura TaxID=1635080 RepID=A0ABR0RES0_9EURO|nr:hypothetical protein PMZ80_008885 [Knufia obscura]